MALQSTTFSNGESLAAGTALPHAHGALLRACRDCRIALKSMEFSGNGSATYFCSQAFRGCSSKRPP